MNDPKKFWLILAFFLLLIGFLSAFLQKGASVSTKKPLSQEWNMPSSRPAPPKEKEEEDLKVDPLRGVVGDKKNIKYFQS